MDFENIKVQDTEAKVEVTCIKIECSLHYFLWYGMETRKLAWPVCIFFFFFFKQITTHHSVDTSFVSPSRTEMFIGILEPRPTAQPRKKATYMKTAPAKKDLHFARHSASPFLVTR